MALFHVAISMPYFNALLIQTIDDENSSEKIFQGPS